MPSKEELTAFRDHAEYCSRELPAAGEWVGICNAAIAGDVDALEKCRKALEGLDWPWQ